MVDRPLGLMLPERTNQPPRSSNIYLTLTQAQARFRFSPEQPCANLFAADFVARASLKQTEGGWTWRFDPSSQTG